LPYQPQNATLLLAVHSTDVSSQTNLHLSSLTGVKNDSVSSVNCDIVIIVIYSTFTAVYLQYFSGGKVTSPVQTKMSTKR